MPGCLGLDAMWQLVGFFLPWLGEPGRGRALGVGEVKFTGQVLPNAKMVTYEIDIKRVIARASLRLAIADGRMLRRRPRDLHRHATCASACSPPRRPCEVRSLHARVVITGLGIVSCLGNDRAGVSGSLREHAAPASASMPEYAELGLRSQVGGMPDLDLDARIDRKLNAASWATPRPTRYVAMADAIADAGLTAEGIQRSAHRPDRRFRRRFQRQPDGGADLLRDQGRAPRRPVHGDAHDVLDGVGQPGHRASRSRA